MRLAIVGPGRMGQAVIEVAAGRGHQVAAEIAEGGLTPERVAGAEVAVEFTEPEAAPGNLERLAELGLPAVCGTTGWYDHLPRVRDAFAAAGVPLVYAPNFSVGVQVLMRVADTLARASAGLEAFDGFLVETHHRHKRDAPSGTARALQELLREADPGRAWPVTSVRAGEVPGTHEIHLDAAGERLTLAHTARDRLIFARGAVAAAEWLAAEPRPRGAHRFADILFGEAS